MSLKYRQGRQGAKHAKTQIFHGTPRAFSIGTSPITIIIAWRSMKNLGQGGVERPGRRSERFTEFRENFQAGRSGRSWRSERRLCKYPEVRENIFKKSSQTFPHSPTSSQTSPPSPTSQPENPPRPPGNSPTSRSFSSALLEKPVFMRRVLGLLACLAALLAQKLRTASFSSLKPDQGSDHHLTFGAIWRFGVLSPSRRTPHDDFHATI
ncbi:hypothetical protein RCIA111 [Methanocella arvoryzae MRE50]|uniref:Uncharacterized protein n=1 Tax=Methanocella arvoryzae (strain DSM 22066 / NBRC 105507 / MRE50) TaxID=351160 RepID=Q0W4H1_METAR|nr:hypothetical protein RCIA111 [Methanocella arvoryzae MRE50]